ncbi:MAG: YbaB/EbfC family nucleoid-associated protein [Alphaproteobacteria bacterium]|nr:YbaB/EbfC family nucleoid-associated protein [Alphaproteobacteria bacterium]
MKNFNDILKKAQEMQQKMVDMQNKLAEQEVTGAAGAGMVEVVMNGLGKVSKIKIDPSVASDTAMLEDLLLVAFNDAHDKVDELSQQQAEKMKQGLPFKLPF